jgi:hypothetical protein
VDEAFCESEDDAKVLFYLPVTKDWLRQFSLAQVLIGHTSYRGVEEILDSVFDYRGASEGTIHNLVREAVLRSRAINREEDLSGVRVGAHDEIFQSGRPVLVGADLDSTYCYLLAAERHRDETTWGVHLLDLAGRGLHPDYTVADGGQALRAGQRAAWGEGVRCHGDVFHILRELSRIVLYLENRAWRWISSRERLEHKMKRALTRNQTTRFSRKLGMARQAEPQAIALADDVATLADWMHHDILSLPGGDLATRRELFDFVVEELRAREAFCHHRLRPLRQALEAQRDDLLAFVQTLSQNLAEIATQWSVPLFLVQSICQLQSFPPGSTAQAQREASLRQKLHGKFYPIHAAVVQAMAQTPRSSAIIENLNSRLRNYFFLRHQIPNDYLDLLRFFLNHRRFLRSRRSQRIGKSPSELLTGQTHPHWLELLGFERFRRN